MLDLRRAQLIHDLARLGFDTSVIDGQTRDEILAVILRFLRRTDKKARGGMDRAERFYDRHADQLGKHVTREQWLADLGRLSPADRRSVFTR